MAISLENFGLILVAIAIISLVLCVFSPKISASVEKNKIFRRGLFGGLLLIYLGWLLK